MIRKDKGETNIAKMNKPEVEAVRFRGGIDVIATSGYPTVTLSGFNDPTRGNGKIDFFDGTDTKTDTATYIGGHISNWYGSSINSGVAIRNGESSGFRNLSRNDRSGISVDWADGEFTYDPTYSVAGRENYIWFVK